MLIIFFYYKIFFIFLWLRLFNRILMGIFVKRFGTNGLEFMFKEETESLSFFGTNDLESIFNKLIDI